ncbi:MAG: hypothetical protein QM709_06695 [Spongiibacteraceae bacterium]
MKPIAMTMKMTTKLTAIRSLGIALASALLLAACGGGGSGGENTSNASATSSSGSGSSFVYSGPAPASTDVQRFKQSFYDNLVDRCGSCHKRGGAGTTSFVDHADINFAYSEALTVVDRNNVANSAIVAKVYGGHNCWEASNAACRVQMIRFIDGWVNGDAITSTSVKLTAPNDRDPNGADITGDGQGDGFRNFPDLTTYQSSALYQFVSDDRYCARCHSDTSAAKQQPYFGSSTASVSYDAIQSKIDLNDPALSNRSLKAKSRLVVRLRDEFHNCWTASCAADAETMQDLIAALAGSSPLTLLDTNAYRSKAQVLNDGIVGSSGNRFEPYQIALWRFTEGEGKVVSDTSGVSPAISLTLVGDEGDAGTFKWIGGGGVQFNGAHAYGSPTNSKKLYDLLGASGEYSIEAWTLPSNVTDEDKEIISYSESGIRRNFMLGQTMYNYDFYNRSSATNRSGMVGTTKFSTNPALEALQASPQHVVATYDPINGRRIYVNDQLVSVAYPDDKGSLVNDWDENYQIVLGDTLAKGATWKGALRMVAIHKRALNADQVHQNFEVPPGEKRYVMFNVSKIANMPASCYDSATQTSYCYIYFDVSQYDNYAYLFNKPYFISLNDDISDLNGLVIKGIHIGINGKLSSVGQSYVNVNTTVNTASYIVGNEPGSGVILSDLGTIVPKLVGADADLMYLEFDQIGVNTDHAATATGPAFSYLLDGAAAIDIGWRTFDEISATFSQMTGVQVTDSTGFVVPGQTGNPTPPTVGTVFNNLRGQLPAVEDFPAYLASHQTAVSQLAVTYCTALMRNSTRRDAFFGAATSASYFRTDWQNRLVSPLVTKFTSGAALLSAPSSAQISTELMNLITYYPADSNRHAGICANGICNSDDDLTLRAATAACAAGLANAAMTLQ